MESRSDTTHKAAMRPPTEVSVLVSSSSLVTFSNHPATFSSKAVTRSAKDSPNGRLSIPSTRWPKSSDSSFRFTLARAFQSRPVSDGLFWMKRMVPPTEPSPNSVPWGPFNTSTRSMSNRLPPNCLAGPCAEVIGTSSKYTETAA